MQVWMIVAMSADAKIAQSQNQVSLDWTSKEDTRFFVEKTKEAGVVVMGRKTFETIGKPLKDRVNIVMTRDTSRSQESVEFTDKSPSALLDELKSKGHETVAVIGGAEIFSQFLQEGLITDLFLTIEPVLFGDGIALAGGFERINLTFVESKMLNEGTILVHYRVK